MSEPRRDDLSIDWLQQRWNGMQRWVQLDADCVRKYLLHDEHPILQWHQLWHPGGHPRFVQRQQRMLLW
ncbi:MAG: hypothetical protein ABSB49_13375 [Polyangia bacterium]